MENQGLTQEYTAVKGSSEHCENGAIWRFYADWGIGYIAEVKVTYTVSHNNVSISSGSIQVSESYSVCIPFNAHKLVLSLYYIDLGGSTDLIINYSPSEDGIDWTTGGHIHFKGNMLKPKIILTSPVEKTIYPPKD